MRARRSLALGFVSALVLAGATRAGDITYPNLTAATNIQDTDLLATWRSSGPLTKLNASVLANYVIGKGDADFLQITNNLSDLGSASTARTNLGLGSAATQNTGTSGASVCLLNANCTVSGTWTFSAGLAASTTVSADTPDIGTTGGFQLRANATSGNAFFQITNSDATSQWGVWTFTNGAGSFSGSITASAFSGPLTGNVTGNVSGSSGSTTGNAATASKWQTARTVTLGGDLSGSVFVDGSANVTLSGTVVAASTATAGKVALATSAQAATGSDSTHALTPASLSANCSVTSTAGYCVYPGGYVHEWGHYDSGTTTGWNGAAGTTINFPYTPAHGCYGMQAITDNQGGVSSPLYGLQVITSPSTVGMTVQSVGYQSGSRNAVEGFYWSADCY